MKQNPATALTNDLPLDRLCDKTLEDAVLGAILLDANTFATVEDMICKTTFSDPMNGEVWELIRSTYQRNGRIDLYSVGMEAKMIGSNVTLPYLAGLTNNVASGVYVATHARGLQTLATLRQLVTFGLEATTKALGGETSPDDLIDSLHTQLDSLSVGVGIKNTSKHISEVVQQCITELEDRQRIAESGQTVGITTGISSLDKATAGWQGSQLVVLAGRPAMGKSAIMLHFAKSAAEAGKAVCIYSLEMADTQLVGRMLVRDAGINNTAYRQGRISSSDWQKIELAGHNLTQQKIHLNSTAQITMREISQEAKMMHRKGRCDMLMIDYLQLVGSNTRNQSREREIAEMSRQAKVLAKSLNIPVILLSQLSRKVEERADKTPLLSDLRESGAIEQDADLVVFIDRPEVYGIESVKTSFGEISTADCGRLIVAKNREGMIGDCWFSHNGQMTRIWDYRANSSDDSEAF